jgi:hypothetical protein
VSLRAPAASSSLAGVVVVAVSASAPTDVDDAAGASGATPLLGASAALAFSVAGSLSDDVVVVAVPAVSPSDAGGAAGPTDSPIVVSAAASSLGRGIKQRVLFATFVEAIALLRPPPLG